MSVRVLRMATLTWLFLIAAVTSAGALEEATHAIINEEAAKRSSLGVALKEHLGFSKGIEELVNGRLVSRWIGEGGVREDEGGVIATLRGRSRFLRHFHDPLQPWGSAGLRLPVIPEFESSIRWMQRKDQEAEAPGTGHWSWQDARGYYLDALTATESEVREQAFADTFRLAGAPHSGTVEVDADGNGTVEFSGSALDGQTFTYTQPGIYAPRVTVTDAQGGRTTVSTVVEVLDRAALDRLLQAKWNGLKDSLRAGDVARAVTFIHGGTRAAYEAQLTRFSPGILANIDRYLTTIQLVEAGPGGAQAEMLRARGDQVLSFAVWFRVDQDGLWRLRRF